MNNINNINEVRARVITQERGVYRLRNGEEELLAEVSGKFRHDAVSVSDFPAVGDYVTATWPTDGSSAIISAVFPRRSCFVRRAAGTSNQEQIVASNIDVVFICMALNLDFNLRRIERYLAVAWDSGATPVVVLTKRDLCEDAEAKLAQVRAVAVGADVICVSSLENRLEEVMPYITEGKTIAFLGSSGVGKSTLINKLLGADLIATNGLRNDDKGRHTTTHREMIALPCGAFVIDTPGMRELGMWYNEEGIETAFADVEALVSRCRFADCGHDGEPGCRIEEALSEGTLSRERWEAYRKLKAENEFAMDAGGYLAAKREKFRQIAKTNKAMEREKSSRNR